MGEAGDRKDGPDRGTFRFRFSAARKYRDVGLDDTGERPLFRRWEATGLLLLVTVGAAFIPPARGETAAGTLLLDAAARGDLRARFFSIAPPLLALLVAVRSSRYLVRPFQRLAGILMVSTLAAVAVYLAFLIGLSLGLSAASLRHSRLQVTFPGALAGWALILVVASIRLIAWRVSRGLAAAREALAAGRKTER